MEDGNERVAREAAEHARDLRVMLFRVVLSLVYVACTVATWSSGVTAREWATIVGAAPVFIVAVIAAGWVANGVRRD